jgi:DNA processing protein
VDERKYQIALSILNGLGPITCKTLVKAVGSAEGVFKEKQKNLNLIQGIKQPTLRNLDRDNSLIRAEQELEFIGKNNVQVYYYEDPNYPFKLKQCLDSPTVLYTLGKVQFNKQNISVVGMRKSTSYGKKMVDNLVKDLAPLEVQIVSGLAHGIDKAAHEAAIHNNLSTLGVLGHGLDTLYPAAHRGLAKKMLENGGLVTEFISGTIGEPSNFPRRNRIVAGLSEATVVVESSESGGSLITANLANDYNREVFAFPGPADRETSKGCNNLIKRSRAHLISSAEDMANVLGWELTEKAEAVDPTLFNDLNEEEAILLGIFQEKGEIDIDSLAVATDLKSSKLSVHLFNLEMKGVIKTLAGKRYCLA